jgi:hypothetical protein
VNHLVHLSTAGICAFVCFVAGMVLIGMLKDAYAASLRLRLLEITSERNELKAELGNLNRQYYDLENVLDMKGREVGQLRAEVLKLRRLRLVGGEGPGAA